MPQCLDTSSIEVNKQVLDIWQRTNTVEKLVICNFQFPKDINRPLFLYTNTCIIKHINHQNINLTFSEACLVLIRIWVLSNVSNDFPNAALAVIT